MQNMSNSRCFSLLVMLLIASSLASPLGPNVTLRGGTVMPSIGLGSSGHCHPDPDGSEASACSNYKATLSAIQAGYRSFHDALSYSNQAGVGAAVKASGVPRDELFMMSMVPKYLMGYNNLRGSLSSAAASRVSRSGHDPSSSSRYLRLASHGVTNESLS